MKKIVFVLLIGALFSCNSTAQKSETTEEESFPVSKTDIRDSIRRYKKRKAFNY